MSFKAIDPQRTDAVRGSAVDFHLQHGRCGFDVDLRSGIRQCRSSEVARRDGQQQAILGGLPACTAKRRADGEAPVVPQCCRALGVGRFGQCALEADVDRADCRPSAGLGDQAISRNARRVRLEANGGAEVPFGREDLDRGALGPAQFPFLVRFIGIFRQAEARERFFKGRGDAAADACRSDQPNAFLRRGRLLRDCAERQAKQHYERCQQYRAHDADQVEGRKPSYTAQPHRSPLRSILAKREPRPVRLKTPGFASPSVRTLNPGQGTPCASTN